MEEKKLSEKESIEVIENMIHAASREQSSASAFYFILWGAVIMVYSLLSFVALTTQATWLPFASWLFIAGAVASIIHSKRRDKVETTRSWFDTLYVFVWAGTSVCIGITWVFLQKLGVTNVIPISLMLYGLASFITGGTTRYYPSLAGGIISFVCVIFAFRLSFAYQHLICAFAVLCVHVIPGVMMKAYYKKKYAQ